MPPNSANEAVLQRATGEHEPPRTERPTALAHARPYNLQRAPSITFARIPPVYGAEDGNARSVDCISRNSGVPRGPNTGTCHGSAGRLPQHMLVNNNDCLWPEPQPRCIFGTSQPTANFSIFILSVPQVRTTTIVFEPQTGPHSTSSRGATQESSSRAPNIRTLVGMPIYRHCFHWQKVSHGRNSGYTRSETKRLQPFSTSSQMLPSPPHPHAERRGPSTTQRAASSPFR